MHKTGNGTLKLCTYLQHADAWDWQLAPFQQGELGVNSALKKL
jgi:hypothetical protein